jgi:hypothetical protein
MVIIKKIKYGIPVYQKWFSDKIEIGDALRVVMYKQSFHTPPPPNTNTIRQFEKKVLGYKKENFYTLETDLTCLMDSIFKGFSSTVRNEIRRCERKGIKVMFSETVENFISVYNNFAEVKGLSLQSVANMNSYRDNLVITSVFLENTIFAVHSYLIDKKQKRVRLLHSGSQRFSETINKNLISSANKFLHYSDIQYFKENNFEIYDWGGISRTENGIDEFKMSFGGTVIMQYNYYSYPYLFFMKLQEITRRYNGSIYAAKVD